MGIGTGKSFSKDVLQIEITGPDQDQFSVIDIPGLFSVTDKTNQTTREDIDWVREMIKGYMHNERTIILVVVPANADIATQEILQMARDKDRDGRRTLGIITKPDLVEKGTEDDIANVIKGNDHELKHGWYMVKNPNQQELRNTTLDREALEAELFSETEPWNSLPKDQLGISALKIKMQEILGEMLWEEFPKVPQLLQIIERSG